MPKPKTKPKKPYKDFPLFAHRNGQWCKTIKGRHWYFGLWEDHEAALNLYLDERDEIQAGRDPRRTDARYETSDGTVAGVVEEYLTNLENRRNREEISPTHYSDCVRSCAVITQFFGKVQSVKTLRARDFAALRKSFPGTWGPTKISNEIQRMRTVFTWAKKEELIEQIPNFGNEFVKPPKRVVRLDHQEKKDRNGDQAYQPDELRLLLETSTGWLRACILLGINAGFGASDCGRLTSNLIKDDWFRGLRNKSSVPRQFWFWPQTLEAIQDAMKKRPIPKQEKDDKLCFLTRTGMPVWWESDAGKCDNVGERFTKLSKRIGVKRVGRGFYGLRKTFETVASNTADQPAIDLVMGHLDSSMAGVYRQSIDDERIIKVCQYVRSWLFDDK